MFVTKPEKGHVIKDITFEFISVSVVTMQYRKVNFTVSLTSTSSTVIVYKVFMYCRRELLKLNENTMCSDFSCLHFHYRVEIFINQF